MPESWIAKNPKYLGKLVAVNREFNILGNQSQRMS